MKLEVTNLTKNYGEKAFERELIVSVSEYFTTNSD